MQAVNLIILLFSCTVNARHITNADPQELVVQISTGKIKGKKHETVDEKRHYYAFKGIPYAESPVGYLRFQPPVPQKSWKGTLNTIEDRPPCIQSANPIVGNEDCLFINVYTTQHPGTSDSSLLPVMVYIYGGGFMAGVSTYNDVGPDHFLDQNVLIVTFNYRLGVFGFFSTGDLVVPGNNGLKDQVLALKWVKKNIQKFGGDPNQVTVFGQSAGSASVSYLLQTDLTKGLFQKSIMQSGVSLVLWAYSRHNLEMTEMLQTDLNIKGNSTVLVKELRRLNSTYLHTKANAAVSAKYLKTSAREGFFFAPVYEPEHRGAFITEKSYERLSRGAFHKVPCIIGYNSLEGTFDLGGLKRLIVAKWDIEPNTLVPIDMNITSFLTRTKVALKIKSHYFGITPAAFSTYKAQQFIGDDQFVRPIQEHVRLLSKHVPVYFYRFSYEGGLWGLANRTQSGVAHSEELGYMFRSKYTPTPKDLKVKKRILKLWTNFAKKGNPTYNYKHDPDLGVDWPKVNSRNSNDLVYLEIGENLEIKVNPDHENMQFWNDLFKSYAKTSFDTY